MKSLGPGTKRWLGICVRVVFVLSTVGALWWFLRGIDVDALGRALEHAMLWPLVVAALFNIASQVVSAWGWRIMLEPRHRVPYRRLLRYEFAAQAASVVSPARAGEVIRFWFLKRDAVPPGTTGALIWLEKLFGAIAMALLVAPVPWLLSGLPGVVGGFIALFAGVMVVQLVVFVVVARRDASARVPKALRGVVDGMYFLRSPRRTGAMLAVMLLGESADAAGAVAVLYALHIDVPVAGAIMVLFLIDFSNLVPIAPGHVGTFEVGALYGLSVLHVQQDAALAFALLFHLQQVLPQVAVGLPLELRLLLTGRHRDANPPRAEQQGREGAGHSPVGG